MFKSLCRQIGGVQLREWLLGLGALALLAFLAWRHDCWTDEGFTLRRLEADWGQLYFPFSRPVDPRLDPFDTQYVCDYNPPGYFVILRLLLGGHAGLLAVRGFSILAFFIGLWAMRGWAFAAFGRRSAWITSLAYCLSPALIYFGHEGRPYMAPVAVIMAGVAGGWRWRQQPAALLGVGVATAALAALMNFNAAWPILSLAGVLAWLVCRPAAGFTRKAALAGAAGLALGSLLAVLAILPQRELFNLARVSENQPIDLAFLLHAFAFPIAGPLTTTRSAIGAALLVDWLAGAAVLLGMLGAGWIGARRNGSPRMGLALLAVWLGPLALMLLASAAIGSTITIRYVTVMLPGWLMWVAWLGREQPEGQSPTPRLGGFLKLMFAGMLAMDLLMLVRPVRHVWKPAVRELMSQARSGEYYALEPDFIRCAFAANARRPPQARYCQLADPLPADARTIWILTLKGMPPETGRLLRAAGWSLTERIKGDVSLWESHRNVKP